MKTEKLYENDSYLYSFTATVLSCEKTENGYAIILDRTAFFPEQGGQYADKGTINGQTVQDVQVENDEIVHYLPCAVPVGEKIEGRIDEKTRFRRMQTHTGEHILSGVIHNLFGFDNVGFHLGDGYATVDTSGRLTEEMIARAEEEANKVVWQDRAVTVSYPTEEEQEKMVFRSKIGTQNGLRLVTIEGCDACACCAPHLSSTGQVGVIKTIFNEPHKKGTRLTVLCGEDAYRYLCKSQNVLQSAMRYLSATPETLLGELTRVSTRLSGAEREVRRLKLERAKESLSFTKGKIARYAFIEDADFETLRALAATAEKEGINLILSQTDDAVLYVAFSSEEDVRPFVKKMNACLNGKGGGSATFAQGKLFTKKEDVSAFLI